MSLKTKNIILLVLEALFFGLGGIALFNILWFFVQDVNSTDLSGITFIPYYLASFVPYYIALALQVIRHPRNEAGKKKALMGHGIAITALSFLCLLLYIIYLASGIYPSVIIHRGGPGYPLSGLIFNSLTLLLGVGLILLGTKFFSWKEEEACPKKKYQLASTILLFVYSVFACGFVGDFLLFPIMMDYSGDNFFLCLPTILLMALPAAILLRREITSTFLSKEKQRNLELKFLCIEGGAGVILAIWMAIALACKPMFIVESMTSFFPIDFMGSMAIGPYALFFLNLIYPIVAFLFYLKRPIE